MCQVLLQAVEKLDLAKGRRRVNRNSRISDADLVEIVRAVRRPGDALAEHLTQATLLDSDWTPPAGGDPEAGLAEDADRTLPPFGPLLQSALAGPEEPSGERPK